MLHTCCLLLLCLVLHVSFATQWGASGPTDGAQMFICNGNDVTLAWALDVSPGDAIHDTQWSFNGGSQELVAISSHGAFAPLPAFAGRVEHTPGIQGGTGIKLLHLTPQDSGIYSVEVTGSASHGEFFTMLRSVDINVKDGLVTKDGELHVFKGTESGASVDNLNVTLMCGNFLYISNPPFDVEWIMPGGAVQTSSDYQNGTFILHLQAPVADGIYTCRVSAADNASCLTSDREATFRVDTAALRISLLEAKAAALEAENLRLKQQWQTDHAALDARIKFLETSELGFVHATVEQQAALEKQLTNLTLQVNSLAADSIRQDVDFANLNHSLTQQISSVETTAHMLQSRLAPLQSQLITVQMHQSQDSSAISSLQVADINRTGQIYTLNHSLIALQDWSKKQVGFHALQLMTENLNQGDNLVVSDVISNQGSGYHNDTGVFEAPVDGTYLFLASTGTADSTQATAGFWLDVVGTGHVAYARSGGNTTATLHAVLHLQAGQQVALTADNNAAYWGGATLFSGTLIAADSL